MIIKYIKFKKTHANSFSVNRTNFFSYITTDFVAFNFYKKIDIISLFALFVTTSSAF